MFELVNVIAKKEPLEPDVINARRATSEFQHSAVDVSTFEERSLTKFQDVTSVFSI